MSVGSILGIVFQHYNLFFILQKIYGFLDVKRKDFLYFYKKEHSNIVSWVS